jgi:AcrR family transcriptional regulator
MLPPRVAAMCETCSMPIGESVQRHQRAERRDAAENREKILRTAADLIARRGHNVPLTDIADAAGVGVGTFYRRFPHRAALLTALQRRGFELLLRTLERVAADGLSGAEAIEAYLSECLALADQLVALPLRGAEPLTDDAAMTAKALIAQAIEDFLTAGRADGSVCDDVTAFDVMVCGTFIAAPLPPSAEASAAARRHLDIFIRGIRAHD